MIPGDEEADNGGIMVAYDSELLDLPKGIAR